MTSQLSVALRAAAAGIHPDQAAAGLIISHAAFLHRDDFTGHIETAASISDGTPMAWINWYYGRGFPPGGGAAAQRDVWLPGAVTWRHLFRAVAGYPVVVASSRALWTARLLEALTVPLLLSVPRTARNGADRRSIIRGFRSSKRLTAADQPLAAAALGDLPLVVLTRIPAAVCRVTLTPPPSTC